MNLAETHAGVAAAGAFEPVVVEGGGYLGVAGLAVGVAHKAGFLRLDVAAPAYGNVLGTVSDVGGAVLVVLGLVEGGEGAVIYPDAVTFLHGDGIGAVAGLGLLEVDVADNDVVCAHAEDAYLVHHEAVCAYEA